MAHDSFDDFLVTYGSGDLQVLMSRQASLPNRRQRPVSPEQPPRHTRPRLEVEPADELQDDATEPPSPIEIPSLPAASVPLLSQAQVTAETADHLEDVTIAARLAELERKVHNRGRGGRNRLYYEVLAKYGVEKAKAFYVPSPPLLKASEVNPPPPRQMTWWAETLPARVPPPPPPPPVRSSASSASSSGHAAPWRSQSIAPPPAPKQSQYFHP
jgi:hypothetical protein